MNTLDNLAKKLSDCSDEGERVSRERKRNVNLIRYGIQQFECHWKKEDEKVFDESIC